MAAGRERLARAIDKSIHADVLAPYMAVRIQHIRDRGLSGLYHSFVIRNEVPHEISDLPTQIILVYSLHDPFLEHDTAIDDHGFNAATSLRVDS